MSGNVKLVIVGSALIMSALLYFLFINRSSEQIPNDVFVSNEWDNKPGIFDLAPNSFGLFTDLLRKRTQQIQFAEIKQAKSIEKIQPDGSLFLVIGDKVAFLKNEWELVRRKVEKGATLFLCSNRLSKNLADDLFKDHALKFYYSDRITTGYYPSDSKPSTAFKVYQNDTLAYKWYVIDVERLAQPFTYLHDQQHAGSTSFRYGKGEVVFSLNPEFFRNYQLNRPSWRAYVKQFVEAVPDYKRIYCLSFANLSDTEQELTAKGEGDMEDDSLLKLLFSNRVLTMALLLVALGGVFFVLFRLRRRRPVIALPGVERHHGSEFARTITSIFINRRNPFGILQLQKKNFYGTIQRYYYLDLSRVDFERERTISLLSEKSGAEIEDIRKILQLLETKVRINVSDAYLFEVYARVQAFYAAAGIQHHQERQVSRDHGVIHRAGSRALIQGAMGVFIFVSGLYLLTLANAYGVLLFIAGSLVLGWALRSFNVPMMKWDNHILKVNTKGFQSRHFQWKDLLSVECDDKRVRFVFSNNGLLQVRWSEISRFDRGNLQRLIDLKSKTNGYVRRDGTR